MTYKLDGAMALVKINVHVCMRDFLERERGNYYVVICGAALFNWMSVHNETR